MNVYIIGIGLIGGSMSLDIQEKYPKAVIYGIDSNEAHLEEAVQPKLIHKKATLQEVQNADIVIVTIPVKVSIVVITEVLNTINDDALVIDAGSTKGKICESIATHPKRRNFLAAHPIAGTEFSGPQAAIKGLFFGKTNIICEVEKTAFSLQETALELFKNLGMRIRYMDSKSHDKHIAYVSHLSHISAFMLGKTVIEKEKNERDIFDLAGSGFASTVRLAKSSPDMWTPIFEQNKANVIETLEEYICNLQEFKNLMLQDNFEGIYQEMENTNHIKKILKGIK